MNATQSFWQQALDVWEKGGSLMPILAALSVYAYYVGFDLWFRLRTMLPSQRDGKLIADMAADPEKAAGRLHLLLRHCLGYPVTGQESNWRQRPKNLQLLLLQPLEVRLPQI